MPRIFLVLLLVCFSSSSYADGVFVGEWNMMGNHRTDANGSMVIPDQSAYSFDALMRAGTSVDSCTTSSNGQNHLSYAARFDRSQKSHLYVGHGDEFGQGDIFSVQNEGSFTVGAWVKLDYIPALSRATEMAKGTYFPILSKVNMLGNPPHNGSGEQLEWEFKVTYKRAMLVLWGPGGTSHATISYPLPWHADTFESCFDDPQGVASRCPCWHFIAISYNKDERKSRFYAIREKDQFCGWEIMPKYHDTERAMHTSSEMPSVVQSQSKVRIGASHSGFFNGLLRGVFLSRGELSKDQVFSKARETWPLYFTCQHGGGSCGGTGGGNSQPGQPPKPPQSTPKPPESPGHGQNGGRGQHGQNGFFDPQ